MLYIDRVKLQNFRCFESIILSADRSGSTAPWTLLTGDNASGKTTLLKAIALGLCDRSSAAGLLRESDSGYIRHGKTFSTIEITLATLSVIGPDTTYTITTTLTPLGDNLEHIDQETDPEENFPWNHIFVCGYGAGRGTSGTGDIAGYSAINAVYNLFNYSEGLQNPELIIRRLKQAASRDAEVLQTANHILALSTCRLADEGHPDAGIRVTDPRGLDIAFRDLADGYKSTFLWVTDFLGWALAKQQDEMTGLEGIVIIDELEQHLHPKWQKTIISTLRDIWPRIQFYVSTHSPLIARSFLHLSDVGPHRHFHLRTTVGNTPEQVEALPMPSMGGRRTDQILASEAFDYLIDDDPDAGDILRDLSELLGQPTLTPAQRGHADLLKQEVQKIQSIRTGQTEIERSAAEWTASMQAIVISELESQYESRQLDKD